MRIAAVLILTAMLSAISCRADAQDWQSVLMLETRAGLTSNTYLSPLLPEWDRDGTAAYMMFAPVGQAALTYDNISAEFTLGAIYKPFFDERDAWSGLFGVVSSRYRLSRQFTAGLEAGGGRFSTIFDNNQYWLQPVISWSPSMFTQLRLRAGSSFRQVSSLLEENGDNSGNGSNLSRFDNYILELETWPDFRWQLRGALFGNLDSPASNLGLRGFATYRINPELQLNLNAGLERYRYDLIIQTGGGGPPGGPPAGPPGGRPGVQEQILDESDMILRAGGGLTWQFHPLIALNMQADLMNYASSATDESFPDYQISAGLRFSFNPASRLNRGKADVQWLQNDSQTVVLNLNYSGEGQLYITGNFNNWEQPGKALIRQTDSRYAVRLDLEPGVYEYKILLIEDSEEKWIEFSSETYTVSDGFGGLNGLIFIE